MMELLHAAGVRIGLVTNGEQWMLVDAPRDETTGFASWYAALWLEERLTLRAFRSLLGAPRFFGVAEKDTLEALLAESAENQQEVTDQLGYQVRRAVEVLVSALDRADQDHARSLLAGVPESELYEAALTVMMRLVFLFCAEERELLLLGDPLFDQSYAVSPLREQLREAADQQGEEVLERRHDAWSRLLATFRAVHGGVRHERMTIPPYGGALFDPDRFPFLEGRRGGTAWRDSQSDPLPVDNRTVLHLLEALQLLRVKIPGGGPAEARRLSFRALDIEQIGHVYEGLLDHTAKRAPEVTLGLAGTRDKTRDYEPEVPLSELEALAAKGRPALLKWLADETGRSAKTLEKLLDKQPSAEDEQRFQVACGAGKDGGALWQRIRPFALLVRNDSFGHPVVVHAGSVYVTEGTDRRSTGTQYTPRSLTEPIVKHALEPLVYVGPAEGTPAADWKLRPPKELLDLKICDFACGSGAFLVQACRYLSERLLEAWEEIEQANTGSIRITPEGEISAGLPEERLIPKDPDERDIYARRLVAQRCLYGVDINPLAVEMAKLSLWLLTLAKDHPFTFLDHAVRCGDSLLGITSVEQLKRFSLGDAPVQRTLAQSADFDRLIDEAIADRLKLERIEGATVGDVEEQRRLLGEAEEKLGRLKAAADWLIAAEIGDVKRQEAAAAADGVLGGGAGAAEGKEGGAFEGRKKRRPFHWALEFPEVVGGRGGFDAFVGNPPFVGGQKITGVLGTDYRDLLVTNLAGGKRGSADLCAYFFLRTRHLLRERGTSGLVATNTIAQGDSREVGLDQLAEIGYSILRAIPSRKWPGAAALEVAHVWVRRGSWMGERFLDEKPVSDISPMLVVPGKAVGKPYRLIENATKSFIGSYVLGMGFVLEPDEAAALIAKDPRNRDVLFPYLNGEDLNSRPDQSPSRWVINFFDWPLEKAETYPDVLKIVREKVKPERDLNNRTQRRELWWQFAERAPALYASIKRLPRFLVHPFTSKHHAFIFYTPGLVVSHMTVAVALSEWGDLALLQSGIHWTWALEYGNKLENRPQYSNTDCFETFPFPTNCVALADAGRQYYEARSDACLDRREGVTKLLNRVHDSANRDEDAMRIRELEVQLDTTVVTAYGWADLDLGHGFHETKQGLRFTISDPARREVLDRLLQLNHERYAEEVKQGLHEKGAGKKGKGKKKGGGGEGDEKAGSLFD
jgi:methylase of polypeptide subunit release factors